MMGTERLVLRPFCDDDFPAVHAYGSDPEVVRFLPWGPNTEDDTRAFVSRTIEQRAANPRIDWDFAVTTKSDGALIGGCGIYVRNRGNREAELGYCYARSVWGRGYATEAARAVIGFGFATLGMHRIVATCDVENVASARVLAKSGMQYEGRMREVLPVRGVWHDQFQWAIIDHEWSATTSRFTPS